MTLECAMSNWREGDGEVAILLHAAEVEALVVQPGVEDEETGNPVGVHRQRQPDRPAPVMHDQRDLAQNEGGLDSWEQLKRNRDQDRPSRRPLFP